MMMLLAMKLAPLAATAVLFVASTSIASGASIRIPDGPGANLVYSKCQACHGLQYVADGKGLLPAQWDAVVASMQDYGLEISDHDKAVVLKYLTTYLGPNPPPAEPAKPTAKVSGKTIWQQNCAACHGADGAGQPGHFPPLAGNPDILAGQTFPVLVVLNGISGPITVNGQSYNGSMPAFGHLPDAHIATVVNFIRSAWGNDSKAHQMEPVTADLVAEQRDKVMSPSQVHALRNEMKATKTSNTQAESES